MAFVDLTKAFDTVNRDLLSNILRKFGCPPTFIAILQQFHTGMCAQVVMAGSQSSSFPVEVGVKQGSDLAPIIFNLLLVAMTLVSHRDRQSSECVGIEHSIDGGLFNLLLVAMTLVSHRDRQSSDCVGIEHSVDGGLFNLPRLQAKTKTSSAVISALQYADNKPFPALLLTDFNVVLISCQKTYLRAGLIIDTTKTEVLSSSSLDAPTYSISGNQVKNSENFTYLGSNLSFSGDHTNEIQRRIDLASSAFDRLSKHVFW